VEDGVADGYKNVITGPWWPQKDLLGKWELRVLKGKNLCVKCFFWWVRIFSYLCEKTLMSKNFYVLQSLNE
jgi:hypothetical protein